MRARDYGLTIGTGRSGTFNGITDVPDVLVGHETIVEGDGVRTGVTIVLPRSGNVGAEPVFAGLHRLNGMGELTGSWWIEESGLLTTPIAITNTHSVGVVRDALIEYSLRHDPEHSWDLPVVGETSDHRLNDMGAMRVRAEHVFAAIDGARGGPVAEGNVGGGTGMVSFGFKGGTGTASRVLEPEDGGWTVGVLVQANHGRRPRLRVDGVAVGSEISADVIPVPGDPSPVRHGSIIGIVATDAPLLPHQCDRLAQRCALGVGAGGGAGEDASGDLFVAFATGNSGLASKSPLRTLTMLDGARMDPLSYAVIEATEEAVLNALLAAETMTGYQGRTAYRLPPDLLLATVRRSRS